MMKKLYPKWQYSKGLKASILEEDKLGFEL